MVFECVRKNMANMPSSGDGDGNVPDPIDVVGEEDEQEPEGEEA